MTANPVAGNPVIDGAPVTIDSTPSDPSPQGGSTVALPVALRLGGRHADGVRRWVEGVLGWQPIDAATARLVPPAIELRDLASGPSDSDPRVPRVLLVDDDAVPVEVARASASAVADAVLGWPSGRDGLVAAAEQVLARPRATAGEVQVLRVGGSAGGVGTSTVVLAIAGLGGWAGYSTLAAVRGTGSPLRAVPSAALAGADLWARAVELPGIGGTRAVRVADDGSVPDPTDPRIEFAVVDEGVGWDVDVLVCRPDAAALEALPATTAAAVVVVGDGPVTVTGLQRAANGRRAVFLPWSVRVARAGLAARVPAGLPGAWLRRLTPLAPPPRRRQDMSRGPRGRPS